MRSRCLRGAWLRAAVVVLLISLPASAEVTEKKFRLGGALGFFSNLDEIESDSTNQLAVVDHDLELVYFLDDPRNDLAAFNRLEIHPGPAAYLSAQYTFGTVRDIEFVGEAMIGYEKSEVGDIEVQAQFDGLPIPDVQSFNFQIYEIDGGDVERLPVQLSAIARFRPRTSFNPYFGAGFGYTWIGFEPSSELNELSRNLDGSRGAQSFAIGSLSGAAVIVDPPVESFGDLAGASVDMPDFFEWHLVGGAEYTFRRKWTAYVDARWSFGSESLSISFNDTGSLGIPVPLLTTFVDNPEAFQIVGPVRINQGGLIDGGSLVPEAGAPPGTDCAVNATDCEFGLVPDGTLDTGYYYVQGGRFDYEGLSVALGVRYTF